VRVAFDTNIIISALTLPGGSADHALAVILEGRAVLPLSKPILGETLGVLGRKFSRDTEELARVAIFLTELTESVVPEETVRALADEADNRILQCAVAGSADVIVTGDRAMLALRHFRGVAIISLREFLRRTGPESG
jgi:putative PIN family toxin of toxin-antitoxin system